jgi:hypothetical protein
LVGNEESKSEKTFTDARLLKALHTTRHIFGKIRQGELANPRDIVRAYCSMLLKNM